MEPKPYSAKLAAQPEATKYPNADVLMPNTDGSLDLGQVDAAAAAVAAINPGPIRLPYGIPTSWGFGLAHVEAKDDRVRAITKLGFPSAQQFIREVAANWNVIVEGKDGKPLLVWQKGGYDLTIVVSWKIDHWSVTTALPYRVAQGKVIYKR